MSENIEITKTTHHNGFKISDGVTVRDTKAVSDDMALLLDRRKNGSSDEKRLIEGLFEYQALMVKNIDHGEDGNMMQQKLYRLYMNVVDGAEGADFRLQWSIILLFAKLHKDTTFRSDMINRYSYLWNTGEDKLAGFQMLNNIVLLTMDAETRRRNVRRQIDFDKSLSKYMTAASAQKISGFYRN